MNQLGKRLASGDRDAFAELYDLCADRLHHYLTIRLGTRDLADEVLQETFIRLVRYRRKLARAEDLRAYVFGVARNESARMLDKMRRGKGDRASPASLDLFEAVDGDDQTHRELADLVAAGLARLTSPQREIVELKVYGWLTFAEIARVTSLPQGTVATRYRAAMAKLKRFFGKEL